MKSTIKAIPTESVGMIRFGMTREMVRTTVGMPFTVFCKSRFSKNTTDDFGFMHVFYDEKDICEAVELFDDCVVMVDDVCLMPSDKGIIDGWLKTRDAAIEVSPDSSVSKSLSIGVAASDGKIESVLFGRAGYYD